ncbi:SDR family NAD(P)-dependent oxidoreductase [Halopenitus sp. H-Gu1]|uniref:SDR family NAD(P)-dependent oxidoreductase n=1 Tax=Halopenitus sp. H-Gu1 TaxID=3242697 RepID=UPI00359DC9C1
MTGQLQGQTAVITGSSSGIGSGIAKRFAKEGANVITNSRSLERAESTATEIEAAGGTAIAVEADVTDREAMGELIDTAVDEFGSLDVMVNNAGTTVIDSFVELDPEDWRHVVEVNLTGVFNGAQAAATQMTEQDAGGQIINIGSIYGMSGVQGRTPYNASKAGVHNLTRGMAVELAEHDIGVNALAPGFIRTAMDEQTRDDETNEDRLDRSEWPYYGYSDEHIQNRTPMDRYGSTEEMANCAVFLAVGEHYMTGEIMTADGGWNAFGWGSKGT